MMRKLNSSWWITCLSPVAVLIFLVLLKSCDQSCYVMFHDHFKGLVPRLQKELLAMRPFQSVFHVNKAADPTGDAWRGARDFGKVAPLSAYLSRTEYEECGPYYFAEHNASNRRFELVKE